MFTWICPKCKSEVPPSYNECPNCAAAKVPVPQTIEPAQPAPVVNQAKPPVYDAAPAARGVPSWVVAAGSMVGIVALLAILYIWVLPSRRATPTTAAAEQPAVSGVPLNAHPLAKHLEISGIRLTEDERQRAQIQFVVTNHSGADLPELKMEITLVSSGKKAAFNFPFTLPSLGPYESKDFSTLVKTQLRVYELPDWQFLRAEFKIISPQ